MSTATASQPVASYVPSDAESVFLPRSEPGASLGGESLRSDHIDSGDQIDNGDHIERLFAQHLQRLGIERVLDIGSNGGRFGIQLRRCGYAGLIYSIEPSAAVHEQLLVTARGDLSWFALAPQETVAAGRCLRAEDLRQIEALKIDALEQADEVITGYLPHIGNVRLLLVTPSWTPGERETTTLRRLDRRLVEELGFSRVVQQVRGSLYIRPGPHIRPEPPPRSRASSVGLRIAAVATSIGGALERRLADGSDLGPLWLQACVQSWRRIAGRVVSVAECPPPMDLEWHRTETRPSIAQLFAALPLPAGSHLLLTNADIVLTDALRELIPRLQPEAVYYGNRVDVERAAGASGGLSIRGVYRVGFDYFVLPAAFIHTLIDARLMPDSLRIGAPWWDYTLPLLAVACGFALKRLPQASPLALHYWHVTRYSPDLWHANREVFIRLTAQLLQDKSCCAANFLGQLLQQQSGIPELMCGSLP